jgi:hypothetical protein
MYGSDDNSGFNSDSEEEESEVQQALMFFNQVLKAENIEYLFNDQEGLFENPSYNDLLEINRWVIEKACFLCDHLELDKDLYTLKISEFLNIFDLSNNLELSEQEKTCIAGVILSVVSLKYDSGNHKVKIGKWIKEKGYDVVELNVLTMLNLN